MCAGESYMMVNEGILLYVKIAIEIKIWAPMQCIDKYWLFLKSL